MVNLFAIILRVFHPFPVTQPLALVIYENLLPGTQLVNRLQDLNYRVQTVPDAAMLEKCAQEERPMLVVADLKSNRENISEAISRLKQNPATQHIPVIALAPAADVELQATGRAAGASLVINDAVIVTHLEQFLEQALRVE
jgi:CheY-like chemotaxis protein